MKRNFVERFWEKVSLGDGCWEWKAGLLRLGYGAFIIKQGVTGKAHRIAYELFHKVVVPPGTCVCHKCDNPACVRPDHLFLGTHGDNMADKSAKKRCGTYGEKNRHAKLTAGNVLEIRRLLAKGVPVRDLYIAFGVSDFAIRCIRDRKTWKDI